MPMGSADGRRHPHPTKASRALAAPSAGEAVALHEAAACQNAPICEMLLHRTRLPLDGPIANNLLQQTPLSGRKRDFQERLRKLVPSAAAYIVGIPDQTRGTPMSSEVTRNPRVAPTVR